MRTKEGHIDRIEWGFRVSGELMDEQRTRLLEIAQFTGRWSRRLISADRNLFVVPVDFSREMEATVSAAFALAKKREADVPLLEVVPPRGPSLLDTTTDIRLAGRDGRCRDCGETENVATQATARVLNSPAFAAKERRAWC